MKKLFITGITAAAVLATCTATAFAAPSIIVNSNTLATDQEPVIVDSRTLVPMRAIFEALGCEVRWDADSKTVYAQKDLQYLSLTIGDDTLYTTKDTISLDVPAQIINNRTMVPLRAVSEALQATVSWDAATETVTVQSAAQGSYPYTVKTYTENQNDVSLDMAYPQFTAETNVNQTVLSDVNKQLAAASHSRATALMQELATEEPHSATVEERFAVTYNKGNYTSVLFQTVQNTGGAHPMTFRNGTIYDMTTGKIQTAADILKCEQKEVDKMVLDGFTAQINAKPELFYENALEELSQAIAHHSYNYYLTEDGLTFFFHPYDIAPYASGFQEFTVPLMK